MEETPLAKVYHMLMMLGVDRVYVTREGRLMGEVTTQGLIEQQL